MQTILIMDGDAATADREQEALERAGYAVLRARTDAEALRVLRSVRPNLILLDRMPSGSSGETLLPQLKGIPVMAVSAQAAAQDKTVPRRGGSADKGTPRMDAKELPMRVAARLREVSHSPFVTVLSCGELTLDTASREVRIDGMPVSLTRTEYAILKLLMQNSGRVLAKSVLLDRIGEDTPDCTESSLKTHVSNLRGKLRDVTGKDYIEAVWGIGFRLNAG